MLYPFIMLFLVITSAIGGFAIYSSPHNDSQIITNKQTYTATDSTSSNESVNTLNEYNNSIDWYNLTWNYKLVLRLKDSNWIEIDFPKSVNSMKISFIPWVKVDSSEDGLKNNRFEDVITRKVNDINNPSGVYNLVQDDFLYTATYCDTPSCTQIQSNRVYNVDKLKFSWFDKNDIVYIVFDDYYQYKITGELLNWINNDLGDLQVIENNTFINTIKNWEYKTSE